MQLARSIVERITAQTIMPMVTMGFGAAIAAAMMELLQTWRAEFAPVKQRSRRSR
jgi:hypothetical protein